MHHFTRQSDGSNKTYRMEATYDSSSNKYSYSYTDGLLTKVTAPNTNQYIRFTYRDITNSVDPGPIEFSYYDTNALEVLVGGSYNGWNMEPMSVSNGLWTRVETLTNGFPAYKFLVHYPGDTNDYWVTDPDNPISGLDDPIRMNTNSIAVVSPYKLIDSITASDGRSIAYRYDWVEAVGNAIHVLLTWADYGNGDYAEYTYYHPSEDRWRKPLLKTARDPYYEGPGREILYIYQTNQLYTGQIHEERHLANNRLLTRWKSMKTFQTIDG